MASGLSSSRAEELLQTPGTRIAYELENPKRQGSAAYGRYEVYKTARSVAGARNLGAAKGDLKFDYSHGWLRIERRQPSLPRRQRSPPVHRRGERSPAPVRQERARSRARTRSPSAARRREPRDRASEFSHVLSLGERCLVAHSLLELELRKFSGPFDWIYTSVAMVKDCLEDDFRGFLDLRSLYQSGKRVGHKRYSKMVGRGIIFPHYDPRTGEGRQKVQRNVQRFRQVLSRPGRTLYVMAELIESQKSYERAKITFGLTGREQYSEVAGLFGTIKRKALGTFELVVVLVICEKPSRARSSQPYIRKSVASFTDGPSRLVVHELHCIGSCTGLHLVEQADVKAFCDLVRDRRHFNLEALEGEAQCPRSRSVEPVRKRSRSSDVTREPADKRQRAHRGSAPPTRGQHQTWLCSACFTANGQTRDTCRSCTLQRVQLPPPPPPPPPRPAPGRLYDLAAAAPQTLTVSSMGVNVRIVL